MAPLLAWDVYSTVLISPLKLPSLFPVAMQNSTAQAAVAHPVTYSLLRTLWARAIVLDPQATLMSDA